MSTYILMNTDTPVLMFDDEFAFMKVLDNQFLPYALKDHITSSDTAGSLRIAIRDITCLKDFLSARTLNLSRENAKVILNVAALPQSLNTDGRIKIVLACRGLNMEDNFWLRTERETLRYSDVNLRKRSLSENSYDIAILGHHISATREELIPDIMTGGMFPKYWHRNGNEVELWKTDRINGTSAECEVEASRCIIGAGGNCTHYRAESRDGKIFSVCRCFTNDAFSLVKATEIKDWCIHTGQDFAKFAEQYTEFSDMVIADYVLGNTDRHMDNWGFLIDNRTNTIASMAPLYDLNQALLGDRLNTRRYFDELIYEPTGLTFAESAEAYCEKSHLCFDEVSLPKEADERWESVKEFIRQKDDITL